jgi:hypothetical protein
MAAPADPGWGAEKTPSEEFLRVRWPNRHDFGHALARAKHGIGARSGDRKLTGMRRRARPEQDRADFGEIGEEKRLRPSVRGVLALAAQAVARGNQSAKAL